MSAIQTIKPLALATAACAVFGAVAGAGAGVTHVANPHRRTPDVEALSGASVPAVGAGAVALGMGFAGFDLLAKHGRAASAAGGALGFAVGAAAATAAGIGVYSLFRTEGEQVAAS